jgi:nicotinamidase-related amidase
MVGRDAPTVPPGIDRWFDQLPQVALTEIVADPAATALFAVDMTMGIRAAERLALPVATLFQAADALGVRDFVLLQERRDTRDLEFSSFQSHGTQAHSEIEAVSALRRLPFAASLTVIPKHSMHPAIGTGLSRWLAEHPNLRTVIVVGVGTDQGVYQTAMYLRMRADALNLANFTVVVPTSLVDPGGRPAAASATDNPLATNGHPYHQLFLSHLALHGVRLVRTLSTEETTS